MSCTRQSNCAAMTHWSDCETNPKLRANRLDEIRRWLRIQTSMEEVAAKNRISLGESKNEARLRGHIQYLLQLLDARPAVAGDARELVEKWTNETCSTGVMSVMLNMYLDDLAQRITTHANQQALKAALHEADTWRAFILNDPRYAELWATFGKPEDLSADDVGTLIEACANQRYREGLESASRATCDACAHADKWGEAVLIEGSMRWWHTKDGQWPCSSSEIRALLQESE